MILLVILGAAMTALGRASDSTELVVAGSAVMLFGGLTLLARFTVSQSRRR